MLVHKSSSIVLVALQSLVKGFVKNVWGFFFCFVFVLVLGKDFKKILNLFAAKPNKVKNS